MTIVRRLIGTLIGMSTLFTLLLNTGAWAASDAMNVQVRQAQLRRQPSFLGRVVVEVPYGSRVQVIAKRPPWFDVTDASGNRGWMHQSALTTQNITFRRSGLGSTSTAKSDDISLAGKGFTDQVEGEFRTRYPGVDYKWVDRMEQTVISPDEIERFLREGDLRRPGGGV